MNKHRINCFSLVLLTIMVMYHSKAQNVIDLSGDWKFQIDSNDLGLKEQWFSKSLPDKVTLPGTIATNGKGSPVSLNTIWTGQIVDSSFFKSDKYARYRTKENFKVPFWLQPTTHYMGAVWYQKEVELKKDWSAKEISLLLERCHWETQVWIDNKAVGIQNSLATPHHYNVSAFLSPGKHTLTVRVDNRVKEIDPGMNSHSISDHTQSNWNGIAGAIKLISNPLVFIKRVNVFPHVATKQATVTVWVENKSAGQKKIRLTTAAESINSKAGHKISGVLVNQKIKTGITKLSIDLDLGKDALLWDEFSPNLYRLNLSLISSEGHQKESVDFGMREFKAHGTRFAINNQPVFLRGTLECSIFPKTGYPSTDINEWTRIFKVCKTYGLNHVRFHSHCPPEAAFEAADRVGIYLQVEASSWANSGSSVGDGKPIDKWLYEETDKILEAYGYHPSFCMMAYGNEPAGSKQEKYLGDYVTHFRTKDNRRVYTGGAGWPFVETADYYNNAEPRIQGWGQGLNSMINKEAPQTQYDFKKIVEKVNMPYVSHEIGQWCAYPNFKEIKKYTGVLKAKNFEIFQETLQDNKLGYLADSFLLASGKLQTLCYKADIEAALRTPGFAGFQLLDLHDFPGQGTALVGVLDAFWEDKGYVTGKEYSEFCNQTVPLARLQKHIFNNTEDFVATIEVAHFGAQPLKTPAITWTITDTKGNSIKTGNFHLQQLALDNCQTVGHIKIPLTEIKEPKQLQLIVDVNEFTNGWDFWVYPHQVNSTENDIYITNAIDDKALQTLNQGGKVLWSIKKGALSPEYGGDIKVGFSSIFWNTAWTAKQAPHTLGILCDPKHPALAEFPTEYHSNWQWWDAMHHGQAIILDHFSETIKPIVRLVDDWFENRSLGLIVEAKVGKGKIMISGTDLLTDKEDRLEARQLLHSLTTYINSPAFNPENEISLEELNRIGKK